ncbi:hypothetical protein FHS07_002300 [Microbacterium proteolyticum]|uniref:O-antigen ligase n=1 Tax=Microbacterium proteolyticum TaxID=1572644 RepID=A0A7W5GFF4_9MICO|nr:hypothetical protein [Microbacterium proteolyticum]MBB3158604.1 hypothetical protein [Microbacterium proteolyticum]
MTGNGPLVRGVVFAAGYVVVVQNAGIPVAVKLSFLALTIVLSAVSGVRLIRRGGRLPWGMGLGVALCVTVLAVSFVSLVWTPSTDPQDWLRDALTYIFFPAAVLIGLEFGLTASRRQVFALLWSVGAFGALAFTVTWLQRRGAEGVDIESFGLASSFVPIPAIALGLGIFCASTRIRMLALLGSIALSGVLILSGGRTIWVYLAVGFFVAACAALLSPGRALRVGILLATAVASASAVLALSAGLAGGIAADRVQWFSRVAENGWAAFSNDGSAVERVRAQEWAHQLWLADPVWGRGWGQPFQSVTTGVVTGSIFTLDSPLIVMVKVGLVGTLLLAIALISVFGSALRLTRTDREIRASLVIALAMTAVLTLNGFPLENRGFSIFAFCLIAQAAVASRTPTPRPAEPHLLGVSRA